MLRSTVKQQHVPAVEAGINAMIAAIEEQRPNGVRYAYTRLGDGVTFLAFLELAEGVENPLAGIPVCQEFQQNLKNRWLDQSDIPAPEPLEIVGSYGFFEL